MDILSVSTQFNRLTKGEKLLAVIVTVLAFIFLGIGVFWSQIIR